MGSRGWRQTGTDLLVTGLMAALQRQLIARAAGEAPGRRRPGGRAHAASSARRCGAVPAWAPSAGPRPPATDERSQTKKSIGRQPLGTAGGWQPEAPPPCQQASADGPTSWPRFQTYNRPKFAILKREQWNIYFYAAKELIRRIAWKWSEGELLLGRKKI